MLKHPWVLRGEQTLKLDDLGTASTLGEYNTKRQSRKSLKRVSLSAKAAVRMQVALSKGKLASGDAAKS